MRKIILIIALLGAITLQATENRWKVNDSHSVQWDTSNGALPYYDHIEMSGLRASVVYYWGVDEKKQFHMDRHLVFPMLRTIPNNTHASWMPRCAWGARTWASSPIMPCCHSTPWAMPRYIP